MFSRNSFSRGHWGHLKVSHVFCRGQRLKMKPDLVSKIAYSFFWSYTMSFKVSQLNRVSESQYDFVKIKFFAKMKNTIYYPQQKVSAQEFFMHSWSSKFLKFISAALGVSLDFLLFTKSQMSYISWIPQKSKSYLPVLSSSMKWKI